jgi:hypothetical protein
MKQKILLFLFIILIASQSGCSGVGATYTTVPDEAFQRIEQLVEDTFKDIAKVTYDKSHLTFYITPKSNFKVDLSAALDGNEDALSAWNDFVDEMKQLSESMEKIHPNFSIVILQPYRANKCLLFVNAAYTRDYISEPSATPDPKSTTDMPKTTTSEIENSTLLQVPDHCNRLWNISIDQDGYVKSSGYYYTNWSCAGLYLDLTIRPAEFADTSYKTHGTSIVDGITCFVHDSKIYYHGATNSSGSEGSGGTLFSRSLIYEQNGLVCYLDGQTGKEDVSLDVVSLRTAQRLAAGLSNQIPDCEQKNESWSIEFKKGEISVHASIYPLPFGLQAYQNDWVNSETSLLMHDGDLEYYSVRSEGNDVDSPYYASIAFLSDIGLIVIRGGLPKSALSGTPRDEFDFININLVKKILADFE